MHLVSLRNCLLFVCSVLFFASCVDNEKKTVTPGSDSLSINRAAVLTAIADDIVIPAYANFKAKLDNMISYSNKFTNQPDTANLHKYRTAWEDAYIEWQKVQQFEFGPAETHATINFVNLFPTNTATIYNNISSGTANLEISGNYAAQGFPAMDYLINGLASTDESIVSFYTTDTLATKRIAYLNKLNDQILLKINQVNNEWATYRSSFVANTGVSASSSMSLLVNGYVHNYERYLRAGKFGIPAGATTKVQVPEKVEAFYKKNISQKLAKASHQAAVDFFNGKSVKTGTEGKSIKTYLDGLGAKDSQTNQSLSSIVNAQFVVNNAAIDAMEGNFYNIVKTNNSQMIATYNELQKVVKMLKVDMTSAMSITITYNDNDGD